MTMTLTHATTGVTVVLTVDSLEEMFDAVEERLRNHPQAVTGDECVYKFTDDEGNVDASRVGCAIGCLITDDSYHPSIEDTPAMEFDWPNSDWSDAATELQNLHDSKDNWDGLGNVFHGWDTFATIKEEYVQP